MIAPPLEELLNIALVVGAVGLTFGLIGKVFGDSIRKGAIALAFAGLSIVVLALSLKVLSMVVGSISGEEAVKSLGALLLIGLIGAAFYLAGTQAAFIALGAGAGYDNQNINAEETKSLMTIGRPSRPSVVPKLTSI